MPVKARTGGTTAERFHAAVRDLDVLRLAYSFSRLARASCSASQLFSWES